MALADLRSEYADEQLQTRMGIKIIQWDAQEMVGTMPVRGNKQPFGLLHGGANAVLAEGLGSYVANLHASRFGSVAIGVELSCTHHRAARDGIVTAVCRPIHLGRSIATLEIVITDEDGERTCTARLTCLVRPEPPVPGSAESDSPTPPSP